MEGGRAGSDSLRYLQAWMKGLPLTPDEVSRRSLAQFEERLQTNEEFRARQMNRHEGQRSRQLERPLAVWPVKYFLAGQTNPHYRTVKRLAEALGIPVEQLLGPPLHPTFAPHPWLESESKRLSGSGLGSPEPNSAQK